MHKYITLLVVFFLVSQASSQEIISHISAEGNEQRHILQEIDGIPYLVKISWLDSIYTYDLSQETATLLHTSYTRSAFTRYNQEHNQNWLLLYGPTGTLAYDFIANEYITFPYESEYEGDVITNSIWKSWDHGYFTIPQKTSNFTVKRVLLVDSTMTVIDSSLVFENLNSITEKNFIVADDTETDITYSTIDRETYEQTSHLVLSSNLLQLLDDENLIYTKNNNTEIWLYDFDNTNDSLLYTTSSDFPEQKITQTQDQFIYTQSNQDSIHTVIINKSNLEITHFTGIDLGSNNSRSLEKGILYNKVNFNDSIYVFNFETQSTSAYSSIYNAAQIIIIDQRYIMTNNGDEQTLYDSQDGSFQPFDIDIPFLTSLNVKSLNLENEILIDLGSSIEEVHDLISIDLANEQVSNSFVVPFANRGLVFYPTFHTTDTDIYLANDGILYTIIDDSLYRLVDHPIVLNMYTSYKQIDGGLLWAEKNGTDLNFYFYKEEMKKSLATINTDPTEGIGIFVPEAFFLGDTHLHVFGQTEDEDIVIQIDILSGEIEVIENPDYSPNSNSFFHDGYFYYTHWSSDIRIVDEQGNSKIPNYDTEDFSLANYKIHDEQCYISDKNGIYIIEGLEAIKIYDLPGEVGSNNPYFNEIGPYLILVNNNDKFIYKEEQWIPLNLNIVGSHKYLNEKYILQTNYSFSGEPAQALYNIDEGNYIDLPEEVDLSKIINTIQNNEIEYLVAIDESSAQYNVKVFQMSAGFTESTMVKSFPVRDNGAGGTFVSFQEEGLLMANKDLFLMNENLDFVPLNDVLNDDPSNSILEADGTFYFLGNNPDIGRQVYKIDAFSKVLNIEEVGWQEVSIYPNPTQNNINWNKGNSAANRIQIYDQEGKIMLDLYEVNDSSIDISMLQSGIYYINIIDSKSQEIKTGRFIKI